LDAYLKQLYRSSDPEKIKQYKMDQYLDYSKKGALLNGKVIEKIKAYYLGCDKIIFEVEALSIMPNHIHVLVRQNSDLSNVVRVLKGGAAHIVNEVLERKGAVWSRDYYDKIVRDEKHYRVVYEYIKYNAFKAGLEDAEERFYGKHG
jgi:REP element-mobilizing transposase RayT